ncbi:MULTISPECIES: N-acetylglucosamine kinase [unclassified Nonomuraea]|uniref:N-acetylglucosamine kinase n=1 Tax=unclassified Nonomuraea TaxID=2593643 RepID=UPI0035BFC7F1
MQVVLGVDAGGTSSRAAVFTVAGEPLRRGQAGGANPGALGPDRAAANLTAAVRAALAGIDPAQVRGVVVGLAGSPGRCAELTERVFRDLLPGGVRGETAGSLPVRTVGDVVTAFAAGTPAPSGTVLISGTGAIAAKITDHVPVATADGYGWQLGDEGSAFWLGRAAARATIRALDGGIPEGGVPAGGLVASVVDRLVPEGLNGLDGAIGVDGSGRPDGAGSDLAGGSGGELVARVAAAVHARPPLALAELAPLVSRAARDGDPTAVSIVAEAASRLVRTVSEVHEPGLPIVLAGSVLTAEGPVRDAVQGLLEGASPAVAGDPAGAAAWLAARPFLDPRESQARHPRFVRPAT